MLLKVSSKVISFGGHNVKKKTVLLRFWPGKKNHKFFFLLTTFIKLNTIVGNDRT